MKEVAIPLSEYEALIKLRDGVRLLQKAHHIGDFVYSVKDAEMQGWDGPTVTAWGHGAVLIAEAMKELGS